MCVGVNNELWRMCFNIIDSTYVIIYGILWDNTKTPITNLDLLNFKTSILYSNMYFLLLLQLSWTLFYGFKLFPIL